MLSLTVKEILECTGGRVVNLTSAGNGLVQDRVDDVRIERPASLSGSKPNELAFFFSRAFEHEIPLANPGVLITGDGFVKPLEAAGLPLWKTAVVIACQDPYFAMALVSEKFASLSSGSHLPVSNSQNKKESSIHATAVVHPTAELAEGVQVGPHCVIEAFVKVGAGTIIYPGCYVGARSVLGSECVLFPRVVLYEGVKVGSRVRLHSGVVLGADGFGYAPRMQKDQVVGHQKIYHFGCVVIGDDVEIGVNTAIDRATFGETRIDKSAKIDNLVQIGHNVRVEEGGVVCGGCGLAGNSSVGKFAYVLGMTGLANQVHVGDGARVAAHTCVSKDVEPGSTVAGNPQRAFKDHFRVHAMLNKLLSDRRKK